MQLHTGSCPSDFNKAVVTWASESLGTYPGSRLMRQGSSDQRRLVGRELGAPPSKIGWDVT
eukprot:1011770-Rhodomonas_salina.1